MQKFFVLNILCQLHRCFANTSTLILRGCPRSPADVSPPRLQELRLSKSHNKFKYFNTNIILKMIFLSSISNLVITIWT
uniref:Secreted protein n=1 Tax=Kalanchoe fedtschenkoi TaxID=63787 RepID=A0A7N0TQ41_KALFE